MKLPKPGFFFVGKHFIINLLILFTFIFLCPNISILGSFIGPDYCSFHLGFQLQKITANHTQLKCRILQYSPNGCISNTIPSLLFRHACGRGDRKIVRARGPGSFYKIMFLKKWEVTPIMFHENELAKETHRNAEADGRKSRKIQLWIENYRQLRNSTHRRNGLPQ